MGIPRFYRWLSERYPNVNENITIDQIPDFDNLYLDMNGIIHNCSHANTSGLTIKDEDDIFIEVFKYITRLFHTIKPRNLLYMAVDGCAPRAKMNQQRSRRFRAANDAREALEEAREMGEDVPDNVFDSNCITPGTEFMAKLTEHLRFFVCKKIQEDPVWQSVEVIVSGPDVPGEGEHKIMDYIRTSKMQPEHDPNTRHCLYGLDADLIMLALASHEPHFALLREEVLFGRTAAEAAEARAMEKRDKFQLLHVSLLRQYLELEFSSVRESELTFKFDSERVIDDFIIFCILVGNDFLPHLPLFEIGDGGLDDLLSIYKLHLLNATGHDPWLTRDCGDVAWPQLLAFLERHAESEVAKLDAAVQDSSFELGRRRTVGPKEIPDPPTLRPAEPIEFAPNVEGARWQYYMVKFEFDIEKEEGKRSQQHLFHSYLEGLQWVMRYYFRGPNASSWSWYYPYYQAPMISDLVKYEKFAKPDIQFTVSEPFLPFQQLMAVYPERSKKLLPKCFQPLFGDSKSPILDFYPQKFQIDQDGVKVPWGGVTLIPFIDPVRLLKAMETAEQSGPMLTDAERARNSVGIVRRFRYDFGQALEVKSSMPTRFRDLPKCPVTSTEFHHPSLPSDRKYFLNNVLPGAEPCACGFPALARHPIAATFEMGVRVFHKEAANPSLIINLTPETPMEPSERDIQELLRLPVLQIDYPFVHRGRVTAVHTASKTYFANGRSTPMNSEAQHQVWVQHMTSELRRKGVVLKFSKRGASWPLHQPIAEVLPLEMEYVDSEGKFQRRFKSQPEWRLLHLLRPEPVAVAQKPRSISERYPVGRPVLCIDPTSTCFGQTGLLERSSDVAEEVEAIFPHGLTEEEQAQLQSTIQGVVREEQNALRWHDLSAVAKLTSTDEWVLQQILGVVFYRDPEKRREEIGMNFVCGKEGALCTPGYSTQRSTDGSWLFSDLAVEAVIEYKQRFPEVFASIWNRWDDRRDLEAKLVFPKSRTLGWTSRQLSKFISSRSYKKLRLAPREHACLSAAGALRLAEVLDEASRSAASRSSQTHRVCGVHKLFRPEHAASRAPNELYPQGPLRIGQRGVFTQAGGLIPVGARGVVIGVFGRGDSQELELLLEEEHFGATNLCGRAPLSRGVMVPAASFLPLFPRLGAETRTSKAQDGQLRSPMKAKKKAVKDSSGADMAHGPAAAALTPAAAAAEPVATPQGKTGEGAGRKAPGRWSTDLHGGQADWAVAFEELLALADPKR